MVTQAIEETGTRGRPGPAGAYEEREQAGPEVCKRVRDSFDRQGLMAHLGARIAHIGPGRVRIELPARPEVTQQHGSFHAGATSAIADSAGGYAAYTLFPANTDVLTVEYKINLLAPAVGDLVEAVGTVLRSGRTLTSASWRCSASRKGGASSSPPGSRP